MKVALKLCLPPLLLLGALLVWFAGALAWQPDAVAAPVAPGKVLYRVNAGGPQLPAADGSAPDWSADTDAAPSPYVTFPISGGRIYSTTKAITLDPAVSPSAPVALFTNERFDQPPGGPFPLQTEMRWAFPVTPTLQVQIRLYFAEIYWSAPNQRVFDVEVDGVVPAVFDNLDTFALAGGKHIGFMRSYTTLSDGVVNLDFRHTGIENPHVVAIELIEGGDLTPVVANPLADVSVLQDAPATTIDLAATFSDAEEGSALSYSVIDNTNPTLVTATVNSAMLSLAYGAGQHGRALITVRATDSAGGFAVDTFEVVVNGKPTVNAVADQSINSGVALNLPLTAADPENGPLAFTATGVPVGAIFTDNGDGTATLQWTPGLTDVGVYSVTVTATDDQGLTDQKSFTLTVTGSTTELPPVLAPISNLTVNESIALSVTVSAIDGNGQAITLSASGIPTGATFTDNGDGTGRLRWTPGFADAGVYTVTVTAEDTTNATATQTFTITVVNLNRKPTASTTGNQQVVEGQTVNLTVTASDPDGDAITMTAAGLPTGATFTDKGNGAGAFTWTTQAGDVGEYVITVTIKDALNASVTQVLIVKVATNPDGTTAAQKLFLPLVTR